ncbi:MAG: glutathione S-transferase family protein [Gammaproteobacteria bacterium]|nr:glutathione S-transferase family protein [Gammaproteobacteria bacterium]
MIIIHHLGVSQSDRIVWLMEELGLPYELDWYDRGEDMLAPPEYRALHPAGTAPIITDGDLKLAESAAICEYISRRYGNGQLSVDPDDPDYPHYLYWMQFNNSSLFSAIVKLALNAAGASLDDNIFAITAQRREDGLYRHLNERLGEHDYLAAGRFTCADIMAMFNLTTLPRFGGRGMDDLPNVLAYIERISARPNYRKAMAIAGPEATRPT